MSEEAERIVYEESVRTLTQQKEVRDGLRARAGTLLAAVSVATAFLSTQALATPELGALAWSAIVLFCLAVLLSLVVLVTVPWGWTFAHHPHLLIGIHLDSDHPPPSGSPARHQRSIATSRTGTASTTTRTAQSWSSCLRSLSLPAPPSSPRS